MGKSAPETSGASDQGNDRRVRLYVARIGKNKNLLQARRMHGPEDELLVAAHLGELALDVGARSDQAHVAAKDIPKLGNLVESGFPQDPACFCDPRILLLGPNGP